MEDRGRRIRIRVCARGRLTSFIHTPEPIMADARLHELAGTQDFHAFVSTYRDLFPDDVLTIRQPLSADQDVTALVAELAARGRHEMLSASRSMVWTHRSSPTSLHPAVA